MNTFNFDPFPLLETERLLLRKLEYSDASQIIKLRGSEEAMAYIPKPRVKTEEQAVEFIKTILEALAEGKAINWVISPKENPQLLMGVIGYFNINPESNSAELGYMLEPNFWGKGYVPESVKEIENFGKNILKFSYVEAIIDPRNSSSRKVLEGANFTFNKRINGELVFEGETLDSEYYIKHY
ncbi:GNAT family N-acetyltransferase [Pedobacter flavus]|uniref:GNAT family N-acetyltransferase n=1 Tax=Pedobacter flavus TaxID=3113906 RepID=A0ABU7GZY8_9SPHI|nr:GNAT family N-acetyltransferase [Pedobacter sp. VNH31]MEE1884564.1 GNAT family N-acetyltransferase [Pedobacter sp. VNH31]